MISESVGSPCSAGREVHGGLTLSAITREGCVAGEPARSLLGRCGDLRRVWIVFEAAHAPTASTAHTHRPPEARRDRPERTSYRFGVFRRARLRHTAIMNCAYPPADRYRPSKGPHPERRS